MHQPVAVGGVADGGIGVGLEEVKGALHESTHSLSRKLLAFLIVVILGEKHAIFCHNQRLVAVAFGCHPLAEFNDPLLKNRQVVLLAYLIQFPFHHAVELCAPGNTRPPYFVPWFLCVRVVR